MSDRIGGWGVSGASGANTPFDIVKGADAKKQHIIYGFSASFSATPSGPVLIQLLDPDVSPNTVLWEDYLSAADERTFSAGLCLPPGHNVMLAAAAGGSGVVVALNLHGVSR